MFVYAVASAFKAHRVNIKFGNIKIQLAFYVGPIFFFDEIPFRERQLLATSHVCNQVNIIHLGTVHSKGTVPR
jgi:hypothetical protein